MKTYYFLPKDNLVEDYQIIFDNENVANTKLFSYDQLQFFLSNTIQTIEEESVLFIPAILDPFNAYSYDGVEFALRCYFYFVSSKVNKFRIVVLGAEAEAAFWEHCSYSNILKCPHTDFIHNNIFAIKKYLESFEPRDWGINWEECIGCIKKINIQQPASYKTHHSITNEWSIYRWSKYLGIEDISVQKDIEDFLYFNYLKAVFPITEIDNPTSFLIKGKGKVLLIDDEAGKGWHNFFLSLLKPSVDITFDSVGEDFKKFSRERIIETVRSKIEGYDPDVIILDLRLHDNDFDEKDPQKLTGNEVLSIIYDINPGIQTILFSASNKVWNYLKPMEVFAKDIVIPVEFLAKNIIIKESPELSASDLYTEESIENLCKSIEKGLHRSTYLKDFYKIKNEFIDYMPEDFKVDNPETILNINAAYSLLNEGYLSLSLFYVIQSIEAYCNYFTVNNKEFGIGVAYKNINKKKSSNSESDLIYSSVGDKEISSKFKPVFDIFWFQKSNNNGVKAPHIVDFQYSENGFLLKDERSKASRNQSEAYPFVSFSFAVKAVGVLLVI